MVALLFAVLRRLERWLHQHIFKVGWLLTKNFQTTTILYYTFFLPGVFLNQFVIWLVAGIVNVRADRAISWPEQQEIAELRLDFIRMSKGSGKFKLAVIALTPLVTGIAIIWLVAHHVLNVTTALQIASGGELDDITAAINSVLAVPDFWLWFFLLFTISNTMMPDLRHIRGLRTAIWAVALIVVVLLVLGIGNQALSVLITGPLTDAVNLLSGAFAIIILIDFVAVAILGTLEALIERATGDSATFENGRLIALTRKELLELNQKKAARAAASRKRPALESGAPSIYRFPLPIPGAPGREAVSQTAAFVTADEQPAPAPLPHAKDDSRAGADVIEGKASVRPPLQPSAPDMQKPLPPAQPGDDKDEPDDSDDVTYVDIEELV